MRPEGLVKARLLAQGIRLGPEAEAALTHGGRRPVSMRDYATTSGVVLRLRGDVWVNAPLFEPFCIASPVRLDYDGGRFLLRAPEGDFPAEVAPIPDLYFGRTGAGVPYREYGYVHTDRVRVSPIAGCAYRCAFCDLPFTHDYRPKRIEDLVEVARAARHDSVLPARHALVSGGTPVKGDEEYLDRAVVAVASGAGMPVDVMMVPRPGRDWMERYRDAGVDGVFFNLEVAGDAAVRRLTPQKARLASPHFWGALRDAREIFGEGKVRSLLLVGLEPLEDTLHGVRRLAEAGCVPVLSPFRPSPDTPLCGHPPPSMETLVEAHERAMDLCRDHGLELGPSCAPCRHNTLNL